MKSACTSIASACWLALTALVAAVVFTATPARAADKDLQQWSLAFLSHSFDQHWAASMQVENRTSQDISEFSELILKPAGYYSFNDTFKLGIGYKYQLKNDKSDEHDAWQELFYTPEVGGPTPGPIRYD